MIKVLKEPVGIFVVMSLFSGCGPVEGRKPLQKKIPISERDTSDIHSIASGYSDEDDIILGGPSDETVSPVVEIIPEDTKSVVEEFIDQLNGSSDTQAIETSELDSPMEPVDPDHYLSGQSLHFDSVMLILERKCTLCHNSDNAQGNIDLTVWQTQNQNQTNRDKWANVIESIDSGAMPPGFAADLDDTERSFIINWAIAGMPNEFEQIPVVLPSLPAVQCDDSTIPDSSIKRLSRQQLTDTLFFYFRPGFKEKLETYFNFAFSLLPDDVELSGNELGNAYQEVSPVHVEAQLIVAKHVGTTMTSETVRWDRVYPKCWEPRAEAPQDCVREFISTWGMRMYKRPLNEGEIDRFLFIYNAQKSPLKGLERLWAQWAFSPNFLYNLYDQSVQDAQDPTKFKLTGFERATQLSYALTGRGPSAELLTKGISGALEDDDTFQAEFDALMQTENSTAHFSAFTRQWLRLDGSYNFGGRQQIEQNFDNVARIYKDSVVTKTSPKPGLDYYDSPPGSNNGVLQLYSNHIIRNHSFEKYFTMPIDIVPEALENSAFGRFFQTINDNAGTTGITDIDHRRGILTHLSTNMHDQNEMYSNPIFKGKFVLENILCEDIGEFPISLGTPSNTAIPLRNQHNFRDADGNPISTRQLVHEVTGPHVPECYGCHVRMNGFGFAMGNYGSLGEFREMENVFDVSGDAISLMGTAPLDTRATVFLDGTLVEVDGPTELQRELASSRQVQSCYTKRILFQHMLGRKANSSDQCFVDSATQMISDPGTNIVDMLKAAFLSDKLKYKSVRGQQ